MYTPVCIHTYTCTYIYMYIPTVHVHVYTHICTMYITCICIMCMCTRTYVQYSYTYIHSCSHQSLQGASQNILVDTDISLPTGLAFDWLARKLYWTDAELSRIYVSEQDGSLTTAVFSLDDGGELTDIVVHPLKGLVFD